MIKNIAVLLCIFIWLAPIHGQNKVLATIKFTDADLDEAENKWVSADSALIYSIGMQSVQSFVSEGFIAAHLDTIICSRDSCHLFIFKGKKYSIGNIKITGEHKYAVDEAGLKRNKTEGRPLDPEILSYYIKSLITYFSNNGFPFVKASVDSIVFENERLYGKLQVNKGELILYDSVKLEGGLNLSSNFIKRYLHIFRDDAYNQERILQLSAKLRDLPFVRIINEPFVNFVNNRALVTLQLDPKPANRFDFIIGVLPQPATDGGRKWVITGDITAEFNNRFGWGEYIFAQFKRLRPENQEVLLKSDIPYLPSLPIGTHLDFRLFKFGQENIDVFFQGGFQYLYSGFNQVKAFWNYRSSRLIDINSATILQSGRLPSRLDVVNSGAGIGLSVRKVDYRFNPSKGYVILINSLIGRRKIIPNLTIQSLPGFENSFDSLKVNSIQGDFSGVFEYYLPVSNWATFKTAFNGGVRYNQNGILENEKYRLGGNRLLRGFDEESIFADTYGFLTTEFRIVFDQNSFLSLPFIDFGYTRVATERGIINDRVLGVGMGLNFGTNAGVFNISFAAGSRLGNSLDFGQMKIHFGYISLF